MAVQTPAARYGSGLEVLAIAHRGGAGLAAENTMGAFARSYALGLRYLETDVRLSADGVLVVFHDANLDRVTDGRGPLSKTTFADLQQLRVGGGHAIPTLAEVLRAFPDAFFTIDLKDERAIEHLARVLIETGSRHRVCIAGAWDSWLRRLREQVGPELATSLGWRDLATLVASTHARVDLSGVRLSGAFAHVPLRVGRLPVYGQRLIASARAIGIAIIVWTVNDPDRMHRLLDAGVAGIITDRPDLLREVLIARDQWTPPVPVLSASGSVERGLVVLSHDRHHVVPAGRPRPGLCSSSGRRFSHMTESSGDDAAVHVEPALENDQQRDRAEELKHLAGELQATDHIADALTDRMSGEDEQ